MPVTHRHTGKRYGRFVKLKVQAGFCHPHGVTLPRFPAVWKDADLYSNQQVNKKLLSRSKGVQLLNTNIIYISYILSRLSHQELHTITVDRRHTACYSPTIHVNLKQSSNRLCLYLSRGTSNKVRYSLNIFICLKMITYF